MLSILKKLDLLEELILLVIRVNRQCRRMTWHQEIYYYTESAKVGVTQIYMLEAETTIFVVPQTGHSTFNPHQAIETMR